MALVALATVVLVVVEAALASGEENRALGQDTWIWWLKGSLKSSRDTFARKWVTIFIRNQRFAARGRGYSVHSEFRSFNTDSKLTVALVRLNEVEATTLPLTACHNTNCGRSTLVTDDVCPVMMM